MQEMKEKTEKLILNRDHTMCVIKFLSFLNSFSPSLMVGMMNDMIMGPGSPRGGLYWEKFRFLMKIQNFWTFHIVKPPPKSKSPPNNFFGDRPGCKQLLSV